MTEEHFMDQCIQGKSSILDIDDYIDVWHNGTSQESLHAFLGLSEDEYFRWVLDATELQHIIDERKMGI